MVSRQWPQVVGVPGQHECPTQADRGCDDRGIDGVARVEPVTAEEATSEPGDAMVEGHDAIAPAHDRIDRRVPA